MTFISSTIFSAISSICGVIVSSPVTGLTLLLHNPLNSGLGSIFLSEPFLFDFIIGFISSVTYFFSTRVVIPNLLHTSLSMNISISVIFPVFDNTCSLMNAIACITLSEELANGTISFISEYIQTYQIHYYCLVFPVLQQSLPLGIARK